MPITVPAALQRIAMACALVCTMSGGTAVAWAQTTPQPPEIDSSALDAELLFQLLVAEMELRSGDFNAGYAKLLDAARRTRNDELFERAANLALARSTPDQALAVVRSWRQARPDSLDALQYEIQIQALRARVSEIAEPLATFISRTPTAERGGVIAGTAALINRLPATAASAQMIEGVLKPYAGTPPTRTPALVATARAWLHAGDPARAMSLAQTASVADPTAIGPALLGLELLDKPVQATAAEALVANYLAQPAAAPAARMAYVQTLTKANRYSDALRELRRATDAAPNEPRGWLTRGALEVELRHASDAEQSLRKFLGLLGSTPTAVADDDDGANRAAQRTQALLLLSQAAQMRKDLPAAHRWLDEIGPVNGSLDIAMRRALVWAAEGRLREARTLIAGLPESEEVSPKAKTLAESQVLRESKRWTEALALLDTASTAAPDDTDLLYERAMLAEKLERHDDVERLLRRVIGLKPKHHHAHNALGYALADRNVRLAEARTLVEQALKLAPTDPFITDCMGWVEFRLGNLEAALAHLQRAYAQRPDTEIAAHLGEVLWVTGRREEAQRIWREGREREADNDVLRETLRRLQIRL
jgi:tetratricopeptide (TPR) repeat protein